MKYKIYSKLYRPFAEHNVLSSSMQDSLPSPENDPFKIFGKLDVDLRIVFKNTEVFEFTDDLDSADILCTCGIHWYEGIDDLEDVNVPSKRDFKPGLVDEVIETLQNRNLILVFCDYIFHSYENSPNWLNSAVIDLCKKYDLPVKDYLVLHMNSELDLTRYQKRFNISYENFVYTDYMFNRSHALHFDHEFMTELFKEQGKWHGTHWWGEEREGEGIFDTAKYDVTPDDQIINWELTLDTLTDVSPSSIMHEPLPLNPFFKLFVSPTSLKYYVGPTDKNDIPEDLYKDYHELRGFLRLKLSRLLRDYPGFLGDMIYGTPLITNRPLTDHIVLGLDGYGYAPPHNAYYNVTSISFYVETHIYNNNETLHENDCVMPCSPLVTEKTWLPIAKGHFILPFSTPGFYDYLQTRYDIRFPDFLDLSFDNIPNQVERFDAYLKEVKRICEMGGRKLYELKEKHLDIIIHNRNQLRKGYRDDITEYFLSRDDQ